VLFVAYLHHKHDLINEVLLGRTYASV